MEKTATRIHSWDRDKDGKICCKLTKVKLAAEWEVPLCPYCRSKMMVTEINFSSGVQLDAWICVYQECPPKERTRL